MNRISKLVAMATIMLVTSSSYAADDVAKLGSNASGSAAHAIMSSGQVASAASAIPLAVVGSVGEVSSQISKSLKDAASAPIGTPLEITDESIVAGPPPNDAIKANKQ